MTFPELSVNIKFFVRDRQTNSNRNIVKFTVRYLVGIGRHTTDYKQDRRPG